ncbi:MAG: hypothetical protein HONBIEJF_01261 [Fimbriimonadaceae bacterium]|nr:hypothetical protein [Fimbriimonadaceae bacterium]
MLTLCLIAAAAWMPADTFEFRFAGSKVGSSEWVLKEDGAFTSTSNLEMQGMKISSSLTGKLRNGMLFEYTLTESVGANKGTVTVKEGKGVAEAGAAKREFTFKPTRQVFANFHPGLGSLLSGAMKASPEGKFTMFIADAGVTIDASVADYKSRTALVKGANVSLDTFTIRLGTGLELKFQIQPSGQAALIDVPSQKFSYLATGWGEIFEDPTTKDKRLSQPEFETERLDKEMAPMRDKVQLAADVVKPKGDGKHPVILIRTPYGRKASAAEGGFWATRGYVLVSQDVRGRGDSEGEFYPPFFERQDGYDTLEWISKQSWCDGNIGMIGGSYLGWVQWYAAVTGHKALKCIVPQVSPTDPFFNFPIDHGIPMLYGSVWWTGLVKDRESNPTGLVGIKKTDGLTQLPMTKIDDVTIGKSIPFYDRWWQATKWSDFGAANFLKDVPKVRIPVLHISGIWDGDSVGTKKNWEAVQRAGKADQWMIYGPWTHAFNTSSKLGDVDYGKAAILELDSVYLRFFDTYLKGKAVAWEEQPKVKMFVTGANKWVHLRDWPDGTQRSMYLGASGAASGSKSTGTLSPKISSKLKGSILPFDPGAAVVPKALQNVENLLEADSNTTVNLDEQKSESLVFRSAPLAKPTSIGGPIKLDVHFSSTAKDCDLFFWMLDIDTSGKARIIGQPGKMRARYREGFDNPKPLKPGEVYRMTLDHWDFAHEFKKGHRIAIMMTAGYFPMFARNLGTAEPDATATKMVKSKQTIYHSSRYPSRLIYTELPAR